MLWPYVRGNYRLQPICNKCSDRNMEVYLSALLGNHDRLTETNQPINQRTVMRELHFQQNMRRSNIYRNIFEHVLT